MHPREVGSRRRLELDQNPGGFGSERRDAGRDSGHLLDRTERGPVHQLDRRGACRRQRHDGVSSRLDVREQQQPGVLDRQIRHRPQHALGEEGERSLGSDEHVPQHFERRIKVEKGVERVADRVLDPVFPANAVDECGLPPHVVPQREKAGGKRGLGALEIARGIRSRRIDDGP